MPTVLADSLNSKRKSDASDALPPAKRSRMSQAKAQALVETILDDPDAFELPSTEAKTRDAFLNLARSIETLQNEVQATKVANQPVKKSPEQLEALAEKIRRTAQSGIKKLMTWKPSCKTNSAKWSYDGVCSDPDVFATLMGLDKPVTWKQKKFATEEFQNLMRDSLEGKVRYNTSYITSKEVNVRWNPDSGEFKFSGSYGISYSASSA